MKCLGKERENEVQTNCSVFFASLHSLLINTKTQSTIVYKNNIEISLVKDFFWAEGWRMLKTSVLHCCCVLYLINSFSFPLEKQSQTWTMQAFILIVAANWQLSFKVLAGNEDLMLKLWSL